MPKGLSQRHGRKYGRAGPGPSSFAVFQGLLVESARFFRKEAKMICTSCGVSGADGAKFCTSCGAAVVVHPAVSTKSILIQNILLTVIAALLIANTIHGIQG